LQSAIGCAQVKKIDEIISNKRRIASYYFKKLQNINEIQLPVERPYARNVFWMYHIVIKGINLNRRNRITKYLMDKGIETRDGFIPFNLQDAFMARGLTNKEDCPIANSVAFNSFYLPSGPVLSEDQIDYVVEHLKEALLVT
jgi:perosamine synthetase